MCRIAPVDAGGINVCAFLDTLAVSELGARLLVLSDDGYNLMVGSTPDHPDLITSYADHPRRLIDLPRLGIKSSAAGRYQFLERTWDGLQPSLGGRVAFDPINQDRACIELLRECRAYPLVVGGSIDGAISAARKTWASLPGAGYNQPEHSMSDLLSVFHARLEHYRADFANVESGSATTAPPT